MMTNIWLFGEHPGKDDPSGQENSLKMGTLSIIYQFPRKVLKLVIRQKIFESHIFASDFFF